MKGKDIYKELKATIIFLFIIGLFSSIIVFAKQHYSSKILWFFLAYFIVAIALYSLSSVIKNELFKKLTNLLCFPIWLIFSLIIITIPFITLLTHLIYYFSLTILIPFLLFKALHLLHLIDFIHRPTEIYLRITLTVFVGVLLNNFIRNIIYKYAPDRPKTSEKMKPYELDKLTDYVLSINNIKFCIYFFYVLALITTNCYNFQGLSFFDTKEIDKSILQSFITFIAFDRVLVQLKSLEFSPSKLLLKIQHSISNKIKKDIIKD